MATPRRASALTRFDALLFLMVVIWGGNYTVAKVAFREVPYLAFNAARLLLASVAFVAVLRWRGMPRLSIRDWLSLAALGAVGHTLYQLSFMGGLSRTTVSNSSLLVGCSPIAVSLASAWVGHERVSKAQWIGVALSAFGVYLIVGTSAQFGGTRLLGDALTLAGVCCWAVYTVGSKAMLERLSPLAVTGLSTVLGTLLYLPFAAKDLLRTDWTSTGPGVWAALGYSSVLSLNLAYLIWYTSVRRIGNVRTSAWSNLIPIVAVAIAVTFLGEPLTADKIGGAAAVLGGVALTRAASRAGVDGPAEE